jgi:hypothetical protein
MPGDPLQGLHRLTYPEFWQRYLVAHLDRRTRGLHYLGTISAIVLLAMAAWERDWRLLLVAPVVGYASAWFGHLVFQRNRPETFGHPGWSLISDFRMLGLFASGRLGKELRGARITMRNAK